MLITKYLTYHYLFPYKEPITQKNIQDYINKYDARNLIRGLVGLIRLNHTHFKKIKNTFFLFLKDNNLINNDYVSIKISDDNVRLFSQQTLCATMKWVILFGDFSKINANRDFNKDEYINICILLCLMISDTLDKDKILDIDITTPQFAETLFAEIQKNIYINNNVKEINNFLKPLYYFTELIYTNDLKKEPDYLDYPTIFKNYYGYSIEEYLGTIFLLYASFSKDFQWSNDVKSDLMKRLPNIEYNTNVIEKIIAHHTITIDKAKDLLKDTYNKKWNNEFFFRYTFLKLSNDECLFLVSPNLYYNIFLSLKFEIQRACCNSNEKNKFLSFWGKLQEHYIVELAQKTTSNLKYISIIPEFYYNKRSKKSSDLMISIGKNILLIFESKAQSLKKDSIFSDDIETFLNDEERLSVKPLQQIIKRLKDFINYKQSIPVNDTSFNINKYSRIFIFSLTTENTSINPYKIERLRSQIESILNNNQTLKDKIKGYYCLSLNDFEKLLSLLFLSKNKSSIINILEDLFNNYDTVSQYLLEKNKRISRLPFFNEKKYLFDKSISSIIPKWHELKNHHRKNI